MSAFFLIVTTWLIEHVGQIAAHIGLKALGRWLLRNAQALQKRQPPKAFVPPESFFKPYLKANTTTLIRHDVKLVEREDLVAKLAKDIIDLKWPIVVVTGAPGQGKSRFVLELARRIRTDRRTFLQRLFCRNQRWNTFFVHSGMADVLAQVGTLPKRNPIALFVDDAADNSSLTGSLAEYASVSDDNQPVVLIFTSRDYLVPTILDALPSAFLGKVNQFPLKRLSIDGIGKIFDELAPRLSRTERTRFIEFTKDSPFLTVLLCDALRSGVSLTAHLSDSQLRRKLCDEPIEKATSNCGVAFPKVLIALAAISAAAPFARRNENLVEAVQNLADLNSVELDCIVQAALHSGLFIQYGPAKVRPAPDLVGDLILDRALISEDGSTATPIAARFVSELLPIAPERVLDNLADLGWTRGVMQVDLIGSVLSGYKEQVLLLGPDELHGLLERLRPISLRRAEVILEIMEALWGRICQIAPISETGMQEWRRLLGDAMPVLERASCADDGCLVRSMVLVKEIYKHSAVETGYDNHKPLTVLTEMVGFSPYRSVAMIATGMTELEKWFQLGGADAIVALKSLDHVLSSTVSWTQSGAASVTFSSEALHLSTDVIGIRDRAVQLIELGILSTNSSVCVQALEMVDSLGRYRWGPSPALNSPMALHIETEKLRLAVAMGRVVTERRPNKVIRGIEKCLWRWWCFDGEGIAIRSADLLRLIPSDPIYQISKGLFSSDGPLETHVPSDEAIGAMSRHDYFFHEGHDEFSVANVQLVLGRLGLNDSVDQWATFLREIAADEGPTTWRANTVFEAIARLVPAAAIRLVTDYENESWSNNGSTLLSTVRSVNQDLWRSGLNEAMAKPNLSEDLAFAWLVSLDWGHEFDETQAAFVDKCLATQSLRLSRFIIDGLAYRVGFPFEKSVRKLFQIADTLPDDERTLDHIYAKLAHHRRGSSLNSTILDIDKQALRHLLQVHSDSGVPWDKPHWVGEYLKFIAEHYPFDFMAFLRESLAQLPSSSSSHIRILGARNGEAPISVLLKGSLRRAHLKEFFEIASQENVAGVFMRAVFLKVLPITDSDFQQRIGRLLTQGKSTQAALVLSGYRFSADWLSLCRATLEKAESLGLDHFETAANNLEGSFWEGSRTRSIGQPDERDRQISMTCAELAKDRALAPRTREFFRKRVAEADKSIDHDLKSDEDLMEVQLQ